MDETKTSAEPISERGNTLNRILSDFEDMYPDTMEILRQLRLLDDLRVLQELQKYAPEGESEMRGRAEVARQFHTL